MNGKKYMIISIIILSIVIIGISITYAWYMWSTSEGEETKIVTNLASAKIFYDSGSNIEGVKLEPTPSKENGIVKTVTVKSSKNTAYKLSFNLYLDVIELELGLKDTSFKYELYKDGEKVKEGNFSQEYLDSNLKACTTNSTNHILLVDNETITTTKITYKLYIWIDGTVDNPESMESQKFSLKLHADGSNAVLGDTLSNKIITLYNNYSKISTKNNDITYNYANIYDIDDDSTTSGGLMSDRFGDKEVGINDGNIRYYGSNPNNYIDIGDVYEEDIKKWVEPMINLNVPEAYIPETEKDCAVFMTCTNLVASGLFPNESVCESNLQSYLYSGGFSDVEDFCSIIPVGSPKTLYRIIGIFKDVELADGTKQNLVKVVREQSIGDYSWDTSAANINDGYGIDEWSQADLMKLLNPSYENNKDLNKEGETITVNNSLYYNSGSGICYSGQSNSTTQCDFKNIGLSSNVHDKIVAVKWNLGGHSTSSIFSNDIYGYERDINVIQNPSDGITRTNEWIGKIALAYPSDYGYATDFVKCGGNLYSYDKEGCYNNDWVYKSNVVQWLLTPDMSDSSRVLNVRDTGYVGVYLAYNDYGVLPTFYLDSELVIESGSGTKIDPYVIS